MAAYNRRRKHTSKHAVGIWEEFSFLNKDSLEQGNLFFGEMSGFILSFAFTWMVIKSFGDIHVVSKKRMKFSFVRITYGVLENRGDIEAYATCSYQWTASGVQGEKPLVDGAKCVREVGKLELYLWKKIWLNRNA